MGQELGWLVSKVESSDSYSGVFPSLPLLPRPTNGLSMT